MYGNELKFYIFLFLEIPLNILLGVEGIKFAILTIEVDGIVNALGFLIAIFIGCADC